MPEGSLSRRSELGADQSSPLRNYPEVVFVHPSDPACRLVRNEIPCRGNFNQRINPAQLVRSLAIRISAETRNLSVPGVRKSPRARLSKQRRIAEFTLHHRNDNTDTTTDNNNNRPVITATTGPKQRTQPSGFAGRSACSALSRLRGGSFPPGFLKRASHFRARDPGEDSR